jgi:S1-C subfamily serine protease
MWLSMDGFFVEHREMLNLKSGVAAINVVYGAPAQKAGIKDKDIILEVDGKPVYQGSELLNAILEHSPGDSVKVKIYRDNNTFDLNIISEAMPSKNYRIRQ